MKFATSDPNSGSGGAPGKRSAPTSRTGAYVVSSAPEEPKSGESSEDFAPFYLAVNTTVDALLDLDIDEPAAKPYRPVLFEDFGQEIPSDLSGFRVVKKLAQGGMGVVYEAEQLKPRRRVALKILKSVSTEETMRRFEQEAHILGRFAHPGIAQIFGAGTFDMGEGPQPFFAMEFVEGKSLLQHARDRGLSIRERVELMIRVCDAVSHAHEKGIVHRDLKPDNILVTESGQPKVLDFGVARTTDGDVHLTTMKTAVGQILGTVLYMSPEQAGGIPEDVDARSDVYSLGTIFYEMLAGRMPMELRGKKLVEILSVIRSVDPTPLAAIDKAFRGDLDTIVLKSLEKEKERRYANAAEFAADLRRFLAEEPIVARRAGALYQIRKFTNRNRALVGGMAAVIVVLFILVVSTSILALQAEAEGDKADLAYRDAEKALKLAEKARDRAEAARAEAVLQRRAAETREGELLRRLYASRMEAADTALRLGDAASARESLDRVARDGGSTSRFEWKVLAARAAGRDPGPRILAAKEMHANSIAFAGDVLVSGGYPTTSTGVPVSSLSFWSPDTGAGIGTVGEIPGLLRALGASPDRRLLAAAAAPSEVSGAPPPVIVVGASSRERLFSVEVTSPVVCLDFSPASGTLATGSADGSLVLRSATTGETQTAFPSTGVPLAFVRFSPDGRLLLGAEAPIPPPPSDPAAVPARGNARVWDLAARRLLSALPLAAPSLSGTFLDEDAVLFGGEDGSVTYRRIAAPDESIPREPHDGPVRAIARSADGGTLASGQFDPASPRTGGKIVLRDPRTGDAYCTLAADLPGVADLAFSPDGNRLAAALADGSIALWTPAPPADEIAEAGRTASASAR